MAKKMTPVEESSADIKIAVMNNDIKHINETLSRMESKFDTAIQSFATNQQLLDAAALSNKIHDGFEKTLRDHDSRLESLESRSDQQSGAIALLKIIIAFISAAGVFIGALWWIKG